MVQKDRDAEWLFVVEFQSMTEDDKETGAIGISGALVPDLFARMGCALARHSPDKLGKIEAIKLERMPSRFIGQAEIPSWMLSVEFENDHDPATCRWCESGY